MDGTEVNSRLYSNYFGGCAILACAVYLVFTMTREIQNYLSYPTTTSIKLEVLDELDFPAVTICNLSPFNKSKISFDEKIQNYFMSLDPYLSQNAKPINWSDPYYSLNGFFEPESREYLMNIVSMELLTFLYFCLFDNQYKPCNVFFKPVFTHMGPCFTFNHDGMIKTSMNGGGYNLEVEAFIDQTNYFYGILSASSAGSGVKYSYLPKPYKAFRNGYCLDTEAASFKNPLKSSNYSTIACTEECYRDKLAEVY
ncbi:hypothetical protein KUTeg_020842 [Tegillarca granosa]|uniref:Uncharacterized protein n=1 Tax=Tegillarca granosa TaxID=220873 RepID=A0ABQ9EED6_TEGGR|nr:hypothetical protein KUTeg_020842 [Tegillarca granosa]